jgi:hypothetical protein
MSSVVLLDFISTWGLNCHTITKNPRERKHFHFGHHILFIVILDFLYHFLSWQLRPIQLEPAAAACLTSLVLEVLVVLMGLEELLALWLLTLFEVKGTLRALLQGLTP